MESILILYINSLGLPVCLWCDVLLHNHFLCFCFGTGHREKHFRLELAPPGNPFDFYTTVRPSVRPSRAFRPVNGLCDADSATPQKWGAETDSATYLLLFFIFFLDLFFRKNLRLRICFFFYLFFFGWRLASNSGEHSQQPCRRRGYFRSEVNNGGGGGGPGCILHQVQPGSY